VNNVLRWIAGQGQIRQQLVLHSALFSRPFSQDDLEAFQYLPEQEQTSLYRWLVCLPFVQHNPLDGRHCYHNLIQKQLSRTLSQLSALEYQLTRRALANHYRRLLEHIEAEGGKSVYSSAEWLELALSLVIQLFSLPDEASHVNAIEQIMTISHNTKLEEDIIQVLRSLSLEQSRSQVNADIKSTANLLLQYFETDLASQEFLTAARDLIEEVGHFPTFSASLLARIYGKRGMAYFSREEYQQAIADLDRALALDSMYSGAYLLRGIAYSFLSAYRLAIEDFNHALALDARETFAYAHRGIAHRKLKDYERAIADFDYVLVLEPKLEGAYLLRSLTYQEFDESRRGLGNFDHLIEQNPGDASAYILRGMALCSLGENERAIQNLNRALELDPNNEQAYAGLGHVYLEMGDLGRARDDLRHSLERDPNDIDIKLLLEWIVMCMEGPDPETPARLETMAAMKSHQYAAYVCRGVALALRERFEEALAEFDRAILLDRRIGASHFWKSLACAFLKRDDDAVAALAQAMAAEVPLPEVLLAPLRWLEQKRPGFYRKHILPALEISEPAPRRT
ncbi:MAG TPA: tetratricopeptide repeat protein, partial [Ktedonobacteraceae bacterium]